MNRLLEAAARIPGDVAYELADRSLRVSRRIKSMALGTYRHFRSLQKYRQNSADSSLEIHIRHPELSNNYMIGNVFLISRIPESAPQSESDRYKSSGFKVIKGPFPYGSIVYASMDRIILDFLEKDISSPLQRFPGFAKSFLSQEMTPRFMEFYEKDLRDYKKYLESLRSK